MMILLIAFTLILYSLACLSFGLLIMNWMKVSQTPPVIYLALAFMLGQAVLANVWLFLVLPGWFYPSATASITILIVIVSAPLLYTHIFGLAIYLRQLWRELRSESLIWQGMVLLEGFIGLYLITTLGTGLTGDAMGCYMATPKLLASLHRLILIPGREACAYYGLQGEMHYAALISMGSAEAARLFDWITLLVSAVVLLGICRQTGMGMRGQTIALAIFLTSFVVLHFTGQGKVDHFALALALAAVYWAMKKGFSWFTGYFITVALTAKFTYILCALPAVLFLAGWQFFSINSLMTQNMSFKNVYRSVRANIRLLPFCLGVLLAILPFLIKNYYIATLLGGNSQKAGAAAFLIPMILSLFGKTPAGEVSRFIVRLPLDLTFSSYESMSPLFLAFIPLALLLPRKFLTKETPLWGITVAAFFNALIWLIFSMLVEPYYARVLRYWLPALVIFIPLAARAAEYVCVQDRGRNWLSAVISFSVLVVLATTAIYYTNNRVFFPVNAYRYISGDLSECELPHEPNFCRMLKDFNRIVPAGARVLDATGTAYWLRSDLLQCMEGVANIPFFDQQSDLWSWIRKNGFEYLIVYKSESTVEGDQTLKELVSSSPPTWANYVLLVEDGNFSIYHIEYAVSAEKPLKTCRQISPVLWSVNN